MQQKFSKVLDRLQRKQMKDGSILVVVKKLFEVDSNAFLNPVK